MLILFCNIIIFATEIVPITQLIIFIMEVFIVLRHCDFLKENHYDEVMRVFSNKCDADLYCSLSESDDDSFCSYYVESYKVY